jgi:hypothetical protein
MNPIEDQLRAAGRAVTEQVTHVPELRPAPARRKAGLRWPFTGHQRRWTLWVAPVTAMVVIAAVAVTLVLVRNAVGDHPAQTGNHGAPASTGVPRYYIAAGLPGPAIIGDSRTGQQVAAIKPTAGHVIKGIIGSADDSVFIVDLAPQIKPSQAATYYLHQFYLYRAKAGGAPLQRSALKLTPSPSGENVYGMALSPDDSRLAVLSEPPSGYEVVLRIYSMSTGKVERQWTMPHENGLGGGPTDNGASLAWTSNGQEIAFRHDSSESATLVGVSAFILDVSRPGKNLRADSRLVTLPIARSQCVNMLFTPDGKTVICGNVSQGDGTARCSKTVPPEIGEYSTETGKLTRVLYQYKGTCSLGTVDIYWSNASGSTVVADVAVSGAAASAVIEQGIFSARGRTELSLHSLGDVFTLLNFDSVIAF